MSERRETKRFAGSVSANSDETLTATINENATVEKVQVRFYQGPELALELVPFRTRERDRKNLVDMYGEGVLTGDNDHWEFDVSEPVKDGDTIGVEATNTASNYSYDYVVHITLDYAGGTNRVVSTLRRWLS